MMYQWTVLCFILAACGAQQHLTCLRTDEIITPSPPITDDNVQQGRPGRRGPIGPVGLQGLKGEPGIPDNSVIDELRGKKIVDSAFTHFDADLPVEMWTKIETFVEVFEGFSRLK